MVIISAQKVVKEWELGEYIVRALDGVSMEVKEREFLVIKGPSGAGKTTLLNLLGGLDMPTSGEVLFDNVNITSMSEESLATFRCLNSGFIFQNFNLISTLSAIENVIFPMEMAGFTPGERDERAHALLERVNLRERDEHLPFQLSAGEQQRVAIARALANNPPVIIADEPTANLDEATAEFIGELFASLKQESKTVVVATHDDRIAIQADRILFMEDGKIIDEQVLRDVPPLAAQPNATSMPEE
ncbi:MAG TPA: ABC transporter ATP-binding protein [Candidatus Lokiarchaeia archaeon]|nr:ABC transporter ATP-binding protein [Candidatus Lokiarchaeia archaeon]